MRLRSQRAQVAQLENKQCKTPAALPHLTAPRPLQEAWRPSFRQARVGTLVMLAANRTAWVSSKPDRCFSVGLPVTARLLKGGSSRRSELYQAAGKEATVVYIEVALDTPSEACAVAGGSASYHNFAASSGPHALPRC